MKLHERGSSPIATTVYKDSVGAKLCSLVLLSFWAWSEAVAVAGELDDRTTMSKTI
jgi:hypothetical protein